MSTGTTATQVLIQEQLLELKEQAFLLKQREQAFAQSVKAKDEAYKLEQQGLEQCRIALVNEQKAIGSEQRQAEQAFELKQREANLDLQRREDELSNQINQHAADVKNDKAVVEQERLLLQQQLLSLEQLKAANEQENARLSELELRIKSLIQQQHQDTGANLFDSFHIDGISSPDQLSDPKAITGTPTASTAMLGEVVAEQLSKLDLHGRQLKAVTKLVEKRHDDAVRKECSIKQKEQEIETQRQNSLQEIATERSSFEKEKVVLREKIRSGRFDVLSDGKDDIALGLIKYAMSLPLDRLSLIQSLKLDHVEANRIISLSHDKWINDSVYVKHILEPEVQLKKTERFSSIIKSCKANSEHYEKTYDYDQIEYRCPQLGKQFHCDYYHYSKLIDVLYSNQGGTSHQSDHFNPYDPSEKDSGFTIFNSHWKSDYKSGKIPKLTPDLKLFFASPNIENGGWIQFHGPGTELYEIDPTFAVYLGSLCDPNKKGKFTSKNICDGWSGSDATTRTSEYQISIKWE